MLSRKRMRKLIQQTYGTSTNYADEIARLYRTADRQIKGEISAFIESGANWSGKPSKQDLKDAVDDLRSIQDNGADSLGPIIAVQLSSLLLGHPKKSDLMGARISMPLLKVANKLHGQSDHLRAQVNNDVSQMTSQQAQETPLLHQKPMNYDLMLQRSVSRATADGRFSVDNDINRNIRTTIDKIKDICRQASQDTDASTDWAKRVDRVLTGKDGSGGASAQAQTIMRTESCRQLNQSTIADYKARGVAHYTFMSLEASNSCRDCTSIDGNTYDIDDAQEGVNLPPMHPNCQCWIIEVHDTDYLGPDDVNDGLFE